MGNHALTPSGGNSTPDPVFRPRLAAGWLAAASAAVITAAFAAIWIAVAIRSVPVLMAASAAGIIAALVFPFAFVRATASRGRERS